MPQLSKQDFITTFGPLADDISAQTGLDRSVILGIAANESGWGNHYLGNNIFGITPPTGLAKYPDLSTAAQAFVDTINKHYAGQIAQSDGTADGQIAALVKGGYNTAIPNYAQVVQGIARTIRNLTPKQASPESPDQTQPPQTPQPQQQSQAAPVPSADDLMRQVQQQRSDNSIPTVVVKPALEGTLARSGENLQPSAQPSSSSSAPSADDLLRQTRQVVPPPPAPSQPQGTTARGVMRNIAAGELEGAGGAINAIRDPVGNLVLQPLMTGGAAAYDWLAPHLGLPPMTPEQRADLTGSSPEYQQIGTRIANAAGANTVVPNSEAERLIRAGTAGAVGGAALGPGGVVPVVAGAGGGVGGQLAADYAPDWAKPYAQLGGMLAGGAASGLAMAGLMKGGSAAYNALSQYGGRPGAPVNPSPLAPQPPTAPGTARAGNLWQGEPPAPPPGAAPGAPSPAGAMITPSALVGITPAEEAAYRATANGNKLLEPQPIGVRDTNQYIDGENPNLAEIEQQVNVSRDLKSLNIRSEEVSQQAKETAADNNRLRTNYLDNTIKSPTDILREQDAAQRDIEAAKPAVFKGAGPVDVGPVVAEIGKILADPVNRQNTPLLAVLRPLVGRLVNKDGSPKITDPQELWGFRQDLDRVQDPLLTAKDPNPHVVAHFLNQIGDAADGAIEKVAPGYRAMLDTYRQHQQAITEMRVLQGQRNGLFNVAGGQMTMSLEKVQRLLKNIIDMQGAFGPNDYKSISQNTIDRLFNLRDSLRRSASAIELAKTPGSDTVQNVWDMIKGLASGPEAQTALHSFAASHFGLPGYVATKAAGAILSPILAGRAAAQQTERGMNMLNPNIPLRDVSNPLSAAPP